MGSNTREMARLQIPKFNIFSTSQVCGSVLCKDVEVLKSCR